MFFSVSQTLTLTNSVGRPRAMTLCEISSKSTWTYAQYDKNMKWIIGSYFLTHLWDDLGGGRGSLENVQVFVEVAVIQAPEEVLEREGK